VVGKKAITVQINGDASQLDSSLDDASGAMDDFAGGGTAAWGAALAAGFAAAAALAGAAFVKGFSDAMANEMNMDKLYAQMGIEDGSAFAEDLGKVAGDLYAGAYGESLGQVNEAIRGIFTAGVVPEDVDNGTLESLSAKALDLAAVFDKDVNEVTRAAGQLMRNGLAKNADEAFDIITRGFQQGADTGGDYLDTINEYGTKFRDLGLDGVAATGLISQAMRAGARDSDFAADALKEFSIRAIDGSKTTVDAYASMGISSSDMAADIAAGGDRAKAALDLTLDSLRAIEDPVLRDATAVKLFGTKAEDLGDSLYAMDPSSATQALGEVTGAAEKMGDTFADNAGTKIESFKRTVSTALANFVGDTILPAVSGAMDFLGPVFTNLANAFETDGLPGVLTNLKQTLAFFAPAIGDSLKDIAAGAWNLFVEGWKLQIQAAPAIWTEVLNALSAILPKIGDWFINEGWPYIKANWQGWVDSFLGWFVPLQAQLGDALWNFITTIGGWFISTGAPFIVEEGSKMFLGLLQWLATDLPPLLIEGFGYAMGALIEWMETDGAAWALSGAAGMWNGIVNGFVDAINTIIMLWNDLSFSTPDLPGTDWGGQDVNTPNIATIGAGMSAAPSTSGKSAGGVKRFAQGGVVFGPTVGLIGEDSRTTPEIVTPEALMRKVVREESGMGGGPVYLVLKDGRVLAEVVTESTRGRELALR
jgi:hypothetical protein